MSFYLTIPAQKSQPLCPAEIHRLPTLDLSECSLSESLPPRHSVVAEPHDRAFSIVLGDLLQRQF
jgi:hypothetical protein